MKNQIADNAVTEEVVDPQTTEEATEVVETGQEVVEPTGSEEVEVAPTTEEVKQSPEENSKFAEVRKKAEKDAIDKFISDQYGESHGIHTKADYDKAIAKQKETELLESLKDGEVDPNDVYAQLKENDPDYQELKKSREATYVKSQLEELNSDLNDLGIDENITSLDDIAKLDNSDNVIKYVEKGMTLSEAYFLANKQSIIQKDRDKIQQDTIKQIEANGTSTPGALSDTGETNSFITEAQVEAMTQQEVNDNYDLIMKSMKSW